MKEEVETTALSDLERTHWELFSDEDGDWRSVPIGEAISLTEKQVETLSEAGVVTVEDFENLRAGSHKDYPGGLRDLPRIGDATVDKWETEIVGWMAEYMGG